jgi:hypothetical protein
MKLLGNTQLETRDVGETLQFVFTRHHGWMDLAFGPILIAGFAFYAWREHSVMMMVLAIMVGIALLANRAHKQETFLRVSPVEIVAHGSLDHSSNTEITIPRHEITSMGWNAGGQDDSGGLFVSRGWTRTYVVPGATEAQAREILAAITGHFPGFPIDDKTWASLIWGDESVLLELGLDEVKPGESSGSSEAKLG